MNLLEYESALCLAPPTVTAGLQMEKEGLSVRGAADVVAVLGEMLIHITSETLSN